MWRQVVAQSPTLDAAAGEILRYDVGWKALNTMLKAGRSLSGHERNCCFLNTRGGRFADVSAAANIDFDDDGRILALTDWDHDGDEDFWVANRNGPQVRFLRNESQNGFHHVAFKLTGTTCNRDAIGARVEVHLKNDDHPLRIRSLRAGEGYLAQSSRWLNFGLGEASEIDKVTVRWPDNTTETFHDVNVDARYTIEQGSGEAILWQPPNRTVDLSPSKIVVPESSDQSRIVLIAPVPIPAIAYEATNGGSAAILGDGGRARIVNLWASWCEPCLAELKEWGQHAEELNRVGLDVIPINVDEPESDRAAQKQVILDLVNQLGLPFETGYGTKDLVVQFDVLQRSILRRQKTLPVPSSFMIDRRGNLRMIYKGPVSAEQLIADAKLLDASAEAIVASSVPYAGKWLGQPAGTSPNTIAVRFVEGGFYKETEQYILQLEKQPNVNPMYKRADAMLLLGAIYSDQKRHKESAAAFKRVLTIDPNHRQSQIELASVLFELKDFAGAAEYYRKALVRRSNDPELQFKLAVALLENGDNEVAIEEFEKAAALRPTPLAFHHMGNASIRLGDLVQAIGYFEKAVEQNPKFAPSLNNLAWLMSTSSDSELRNGEKAVRYAESLCQETKMRSSDNLDTLAAAYAEAGRFEDAIKTINEAIRSAKADGNLQASRKLQKRLVLYKQEQPFRDEL